MILRLLCDCRNGVKHRKSFATKVRIDSEKADIKCIFIIWLFRGDKFAYSIFQFPLRFSQFQFFQKGPPKFEKSGFAVWAFGLFK